MVFLCVFCLCCCIFFELNTKLLVLFFAGNVCYFSSGLGSAEGKLTNTVDQTFVCYGDKRYFKQMSFKKKKTTFTVSFPPPRHLARN